MTHAYSHMTELQQQISVHTHIDHVLARLLQTKLSVDAVNQGLQQSVTLHASLLQWLRDHVAHLEAVASAHAAAERLALEEAAEMQRQELEERREKRDQMRRGGTTSAAGVKSVRRRVPEMEEGSHESVAIPMRPIHSDQIPPSPPRSSFATTAAAHSTSTSVATPYIPIPVAGVRTSTDAPKGRRQYPQLTAQPTMISDADKGQRNTVSEAMPERNDQYSSASDATPESSALFGSASRVDKSKSQHGVAYLQHHAERKKKAAVAGAVTSPVKSKRRSSDSASSASPPSRSVAASTSSLSSGMNSLSLEAILAQARMVHDEPSVSSAAHQQQQHYNTGTSSLSSSQPRSSTSATTTSTRRSSPPSRTSNTTASRERRQRHAPPPPPPPPPSIPAPPASHQHHLLRFPSSFLSLQQRLQVAREQILSIEQTRRNINTTTRNRDTSMIAEQQAEAAFLKEVSEINMMQPGDDDKDPRDHDHTSATAESYIHSSQAAYQSYIARSPLQDDVNGGEQPFADVFPFFVRRGRMRKFVYPWHQQVGASTSSSSALNLIHTRLHHSNKLRAQSLRHSTAGCEPTPVEVRREAERMLLRFEERKMDLLQMKLVERMEEDVGREMRHLLDVAAPIPSSSASAASSFPTAMAASSSSQLALSSLLPSRTLIPILKCAYALLNIGGRHGPRDRHDMMRSRMPTFLPIQQQQQRDEPESSMPIPQKLWRADEEMRAKEMEGEGQMHEYSDEEYAD